MAAIPVRNGSQLSQMWSRAADIPESAFLCLPRPRPEMVALVFIETTHEYSQRQHYWDGIRVRCIRRVQRIPLNDDMLAVAGRYLAEGTFVPKKTDVLFSLGKSNLEYEGAL